MSHRSPTRNTALGRFWSSVLGHVTTLMKRERMSAEGTWQVSRDAAKQTADTRREVIEVSWTSAFVLSLATKSIPTSASTDWLGLTRKGTYIRKKPGSSLPTRCPRSKMRGCFQKNAIVRRGFLSLVRYNEDLNWNCRHDEIFSFVNILQRLTFCL